MARAQHKLVIVSNRGPYRITSSAGKQRQVRAAGGLVAALDPVLRVRGGMWVSAGAGETTNVVETGGYDLQTVELSRAEREGFYQGVSNAMLWPILHSLPPTVRMAQASWRTYESANQTFAEAVLKASRPSDLVWVQDFHLMLVPTLVRNKRPKARIGWFCHVPWPGYDLFEILPWRNEIIAGLLGADVIGFHTKAYADNFLGCVERLSAAKVNYSRKTIRQGGHTVQVVVAPIGVPLEEIQRIAAGPSVTAQVEKIKESVHNRRIILGVDRLDYTKGIPNRLRAFEQFLRSERSARNRFVMLQIMVPSRTDVRAYADLKQEIDTLVGDINGRYSASGVVPIQYFYRNLPPEQLYAHYRAADVALVTPLRDGMNLVALEYVTCRIDGGGVLVLSEFAGAAKYLQDAILVNPYDIHGMASTLADALALTADAIRPRMHALRRQVQDLDVHRWADDFLALLDRRQ